MSSLLILGAGGHGKVVLETARAMDKWREIMFADDAYPQRKSVNGHPVVADFSGARALSATYSDVIVALGDNHQRRELTLTLRQSGFNPVTLIHPAANVARSARIGMGSVVLAQAVVQADAQVGAATIINTAATVDHDCVISDGVHLSPGVHLGGEVTVGDSSWLGIGAVVVNRVNIGRNVVIGAGASVLDDIPDNVTAVGVPARPIC